MRQKKSFSFNIKTKKQKRAESSIVCILDKVDIERYAQSFGRIKWDTN
jgi:hypothetical protein